MFAKSASPRNSVTAYLGSHFCLHAAFLVLPAASARLENECALDQLSRSPSEEAALPPEANTPRHVVEACAGDPREQQKHFQAAVREKGQGVVHTNDRGDEIHLTQIAVSSLPCPHLADSDLASAHLFFVTDSAKVYVVADDTLRNGTNDLSARRCLLAELFRAEPRDPHFDGYLTNVDRCSEKRSGSQMMRLADHLYSCSCHHRVRLQDVSELFCDSNSGSGGGKSEASVPLGLFRTLTRGQSLYQKFGFQYIEAENLLSEPKLRDNIIQVQQELYNLLVEDLQKVHESCSKDSALYDTVHIMFSTFKRRHGRGRRVGEFFEWVWNQHCNQAARVLDATVIFPCPYYPRSSLLRQLRAETVPQFRGRMMKVYA